MITDKPFYIPVKVYENGPDMWLYSPGMENAMKMAQGSYGHSGNTEDRDLRYAILGHGCEKKILLKPIKQISVPDQENQYKFEQVLICRTNYGLRVEIYPDRIPVELRRKIFK